MIDYASSLTHVCHRGLNFPGLHSYKTFTAHSFQRLRGGSDSISSASAGATQDIKSDVSITFLRRNVSDLQSYLPYLQEYQNPMVARAWPANTNFVSVAETVTDTVKLERSSF